MNDVDMIAIRRRILDWRDKWLSSIPHNLERELVLLHTQMDRRIDGLGVAEAFSSRKFIDRQIKPLIEAWIGNETRLLMRSANAELQLIHDAVIDASQTDVDFDTDDDWSSYVDVISGIMSAGGAFATIPAVITLSTSAGGGILAALGFGTAVVINWPVALAGVGIVGGLLAFGGSKTFGVVDKKKALLKKSMRELTETIVLSGDENRVPVSETLQGAIKETAYKLLRAMPDAHSV